MVAASRGKKPHVDITPGTCPTQLPRPCGSSFKNRSKIAGKFGKFSEVITV